MLNIEVSLQRVGEVRDSMYLERMEQTTGTERVKAVLCVNEPVQPLRAFQLNAYPPTFPKELQGP